MFPGVFSTYEHSDRQPLAFGVWLLSLLSSDSTLVSLFSAIPERVAEFEVVVLCAIQS